MTSLQLTLDAVRAFFTMNGPFYGYPDVTSLGPSLVANMYPVVVNNTPVCVVEAMRSRWPDLVSQGYNNILLVSADRSSMSVRYQ